MALASARSGEKLDQTHFEALVLTNGLKGQHGLRREQTLGYVLSYSQCYDQIGSLLSVGWPRSWTRNMECIEPIYPAVCERLGLAA